MSIITKAATAPITTAAQGATYAHGAVIPTSPARAPLQARARSAFPVRAKL